jgi:excisionase family DNA binding protein
MTTHHTTQEAARLLGLTRKGVLVAIRRGKLNATKHGRDWQISDEEIERYQQEPRQRGRPRRRTMGAIEMQWSDGTTGYVILDINEFRNSGPVFEVYDTEERGRHLLSAADVRGNWNAWVGELIDDERIVNAVPDGIETY